MSDSSQSSLMDDTHNEVGEDMDTVFDLVITGLKSCLQEYEVKANKINCVLEKLGFNVKILPQNLRNELKDIFSDSEVFSFGDVYSKEMLTVDSQKILDSLSEDDELAEVQRLKLQLDTVLARLLQTHTNLQRKLEIERMQVDYFNEKSNEKVAQKMVFRGKLEKVQEELKNLQQISESIEKPRYSFNEIKSLHEELTRLEGDTVLTKTKLEKYNDLPINEKEATKKLETLQEEIMRVDKEIKIKISSSVY